MVDILKYSDLLDIKEDLGVKYIRCIIRNKLLVLQAEEIVRQLFLLYLIHELNYSKNKIAVEKGLSIHGRKRRYDILVYDKKVEPHILVECKSMFVEINQGVMEQVGQYNLPLKAKYLVLTNGKQNIFCALRSEGKDYAYIEELPINQKKNE